MIKYLASVAALAVIALGVVGSAGANPGPAPLSAERCRVAGGEGMGKFAKCGTPGSVPESKYQRRCERDGTPCKVRRPKSAAPSHVRTTRCDGKGDLKFPTYRGCAPRA